MGVDVICTSFEVRSSDESDESGAVEDGNCAGIEGSDKGEVEGEVENDKE